MRAFFNGVVFTLALLAGAGVAAVFAGVLPSGADVTPPAAEEWAARTSLHAAIARETRSLSNVVPLSDDALLAGVKSYGQNCAICHGAADAKPSTLAKGFYIKSPQLAKDGVEDDPEATTFWKLKHGIRFTAMPAFGGNLSDEELWKIALLLKHMDKLPPAPDAAWKALPSVGS
ncbi:MAG: hypothetical protein NVSMB19_21220 [Vulcanimicrobiaceae bacterium]